MLAGALTLAIMILPLIHPHDGGGPEGRARFVPRGQLRPGRGQAAHGVPRRAAVSAVPGILAGIILAIGRIVGETAALIYTAGYGQRASRGGVMDSGRTLAVHMYVPARTRACTRSEAYATAVVLLVIVIGINALSGAVGKANCPANAVSATGRSSHMEQDKIVIEHLDLWYGSFQALKDINLPSARQRDHGLHRPVRLRQVDAAQVPQPHERPGGGLPHHRQRHCWTARTSTREMDVQPAAQARGHGVPEAQPLPHEHL